MYQSRPCSIPTRPGATVNQNRLKACMINKYVEFRCRFKYGSMVCSYRKPVASISRYNNAKCQSECALICFFENVKSIKTLDCQINMSKGEGCYDKNGISVPAIVPQRIWYRRQEAMDRNIPWGMQTGNYIKSFCVPLLSFLLHY